MTSRRSRLLASVARGPERRAARIVGASGTQTTGTRLAFILAVLCSAGVLPEASAAQTACKLSIGVPPDSATSSKGTFLGHALGQTFYAPETLITKVTLWRPSGRNLHEAHLWIVGVDTTQVPYEPVSQDVLLDGPTIVVPDSDPPAYSSSSSNPGVGGLLAGVAR